MADNNATPRPARRLGSPSDRTPRASRALTADSEDESDDEDSDKIYGFTLSYLRRVPELAVLGRRVVNADAHRRAKEERKKAKSQGAHSQSQNKSASAKSSRSPTDPPPGPAVKQLFKRAIRTLFSEGDIVLWSGPVRPLPTPVLGPTFPSSSILWKANTSTSSSTSASMSRTSSSFPSYDEWDEEEPLSDPTPDEEAYVPLTPAYFSRVLESTIRTIMAEAAQARTAASSAPTKGRPASLIDRLRAQEKASAGAAVGPTKEELLAWLRNSDERWARVGEWTVEEALLWGKNEGRLWCVGKGRWEVCG